MKKIVLSVFFLMATHTQMAQAQGSLTDLEISKCSAVTRSLVTAAYHGQDPNDPWAGFIARVDENTLSSGIQPTVEAPAYDASFGSGKWFCKGTVCLDRSTQQVISVDLTHHRAREPQKPFQDSDKQVYAVAAATSLHNILRPSPVEDMSVDSAKYRRDGNNNNEIWRVKVQDDQTYYYEVTLNPDIETPIVRVVRVGRF